MTIHKSVGHNNITSPKFILGSDATGDMFYRNSGGNVARLAKGTQYQLLRAGSTIPQYADVKDAILLGSDATGDLYYRNSGGEFTRLPIGASTHLLRSGGTIPAWVAPKDMITLGSDAQGDIYFRNASGEFARLAIGSAGQTLTVSGGLPSWGASSGVPIGFSALSSGCIGWKDADEIYVYGNNLDVAGKRIYWDSTLTKQLTSLSNSTWYYIYLDESELSDGEELSDVAKIIYSTTAPGAYDEALKGRYNGNDRCIGCVLTDGSGNILQFYWVTSGLYAWETGILELSGGTAASYTDVTLSSSVPNFGEVESMLNFDVTMTNQANSFNFIHLRPNGSSNTLGENKGGRIVDTSIAALDTRSLGDVNVKTDSSQVIEYFSESGGSCTLYTLGFYLKI